MSRANSVAIAVPSNVASDAADADSTLHGEVVDDSATESDTESDRETWLKSRQKLEARRRDGD